MNNYQELHNNLKELKLTQVSVKLYEYIKKINENMISVIDALYELTKQEIEVKILMQLMQC